MAAKSFGLEWERLRQEKGWWHSFELPDGSVREGVNTLKVLKERLTYMPIPRNLRGKRVLDIGAWDGWFTFEMERRGAEVTAVDCVNVPQFHQMHAIYKSRADYRLLDAYDITPEILGQFDYVLFLGVLYHLKHPLLGLERVCAVTRDVAIVESYILPENQDPAAGPMLAFYESAELEDRADNWCAPNLACLLSMCRAAGFARVELQRVHSFGACVACYRKWLPQQADGAAAEVLGAVHAWNGGINFDTRKDEYVLARFRTSELDLRRSDVQPQVGEYGVYPTTVDRVAGDIWQVNFKLPLGLTSGWHEVTVGVRGGPHKGSSRIALNVPLPPAHPKIEGLCDAKTWTPGVLDLTVGPDLSIWCSGLPENADCLNIQVSVDGVACVLDVPASAAEVRQINAKIPPGARSGPAEVRVRIGDQWSDPAYVEITGA